MDFARLASVYPESAFLEDRNRNARTEAPERHGLNLGRGTATRGTRHVGEIADLRESAFIGPFPEDDYKDFLERVLGTLHELPEETVDPRVLQGTRQ